MTEPNPPACSVCEDDIAPLAVQDGEWICIACLAVTRTAAIRALTGMLEGTDRRKRAIAILDAYVMQVRE